MKTNNFLQIGDIFELTNQKVYTNLKHRFILPNSTNPNNSANSTIQIGKEYPNLANKKITIINEIIDLYKNYNINLNQDLLSEFIENSIPPEKQIKPFIIHPGEFIVTKTEMTGGGTGHGPHDIYPDGHKVTAKRLDGGNYNPNANDIQFYQSGSFTIIYDDIKPIRKLKLTFK